MSSCYSSRTILHRGCRRKRKKREKLSSQQPLSSALQPVGSCSRITAPRGTLKMLIQGCDKIVTVSSEYRWWPEREERRIQRGMDEDVIDLRGCLWATFACLFSGCQRWQEASFRSPSTVHQIFERLPLFTKFSNEVWRLEVGLNRGERLEIVHDHLPLF